MSSLAATARAFALFTAGYPSAKRIDESTVRVWAEALTGFTDEAIEGAAKLWIHTEQHFPNLPRFIELVRAQQGARLEDVYKVDYDCAICTDGWVEVDTVGRGVVERCPNGCLPPRMSETSDASRESTASPDVIAMLRTSVDAAKKRRSQLGDRDYLIEKGYDPDKFRISDGMIMRNAPEPKKRPERHRS